MADDVLSRIESGSSTYYLLTKLVDGGRSGFHLTLSNGEQVWREQVSGDQVMSMAKATDMELDEYATQTGKALTGQLLGAQNFVYQVTLKGDNLQFSWKKQLGDGVKFQLGSLIIKPVTDSPQMIGEMFDFAINQMEQLKEEISSLRSENGRLSSERKNAMKLLDKCVSAKEEMEEEIFQKFAAVLNDKKAKIRQLKSEGQSTSDVTDAGVSKEQPTKTSRRKKMSSSSEGETIGTLTPSPPSVQGTTSGASASVISPSLLLEEENEPVETTAKRRRRREPKVAVTPKSKLVLPKVSSVKKTPSTSSEDSLTPKLRKKTSDKSSVDADDLMAEMEM